MAGASKTIEYPLSRNGRPPSPPRGAVVGRDGRSTPSSPHLGELSSPRFASGDTGTFLILPIPAVGS